MCHARGADAIKFQIFDLDRLVADKSQLFEYKSLVRSTPAEIETVNEPLYSILKRRCLQREEWLELRKHCSKIGIAFFATVGFAEDIDLLVEMECDSIKIASADVTHLPLIEYAAKTGLCIQLDTGNSTLGEIEIAVNTIYKTGNQRLIIHQCPNGYPADKNSINLRMIDTLRQMFKVPIAYSDHSPGADIDIAAVCFGANLLEKTITLDRYTRSPEHMFSLEPHEIQKFIRRIRDVEAAMGVERRVLTESSYQKRSKIRRSAFLKSDGWKGQKVSELDIDWRRPGDGITQEIISRCSDAVLNKSLEKDYKLKLCDFVWEK